MPKSLEEIKALLVEKKADDLYGDIISHVEAEKTRGIEEKRKVNSEAQGLRKFKIAVEKAAKDMGVDVDDVDAFLGELAEKAKSAEANKGAAKDKDVLSKKMEALTKRLDDAEKEKDGLKQKAKISTLRSRLMTDLKDEIHAAEDVINSRLIGRGVVDLLDDNETIQFVDGEARIDYKKGVEKFLAENPDIRKNKQAGGSGGVPNNGGGGNKTMNFAVWDKLPGKEKAIFLNGGGKLEN